MHLICISYALQHFQKTLTLNLSHSAAIVTPPISYLLFRGPLQISQLLRCESGFLCHTHFRFQIARDDYLDDSFMMTSGFCPDIENRYNLTRREGEAPTLHSSCCYMIDAGSETKQDLNLKVDFKIWEAVSICLAMWKIKCVSLHSK